jgi:hypothetical protein
MAGLLWIGTLTRRSTVSFCHFGRLINKLPDRIGLFREPRKRISFLSDTTRSIYMQEQSGNSPHAPTEGMGSVC